MQQEQNNYEIELMAHVVGLHMHVYAYQSQLLTKERKVVELKELVVEQLGKWEANNETLMVAALEAKQ